MNWIQSLYETYENCESSIGYSAEAQRPLLPICHITTQTHIEVVIDENGNFRDARLVDKGDSTTIIPATENSASRAGSKPEGHPLSDKLQYLAGDFADFGGEVTSGFGKSPTEPYERFINSLVEWCNSPYSHSKARAILAYVQKKTLMRDLADHKILLVDSHRKLLSKDQAKREKNVKDIFSSLNAQGNAIVRWVVQIPDDAESRVWRDVTLWNSWTNYYLNSKDEQDICLVTGERKILTRNHPKYIRREGDNAKIISANDTSGFTFRGRFITDAQACGVGLEISQKAHNALAWLISRQGYLDNQGELAVVAWAVSGVKVPQPAEDTYDSFYQDLDLEKNQLPADTAQEVGIRLTKKIAGYRHEIGEREDMSIIAVDSATPGRLSIIYYRALKGSEFLERIENWHETCAWRHTYRYIEVQDEKGKTKKRYVSFFGAPAPADIAEAAYGSRLDDKLKKATIKRLLPCIVEGQPIPRDLVESVVRRASNREGIRNRDDKIYRGDDEFTWKKTLGIACALFRKYKDGKEKFEMSLDETRTTRDYLYGRLLAIADALEERVLYKAKEKRATNAARYMQQFSQRPYQTWKQIHEALTPYMVRLGGAHYYKNLIAQVINLNPGALEGNKPLTGEYLLGYYCQRQKLREKPDSSGVEEDDRARSNE
jgi:CRISPR-associated protein Csd1